MIIRIDYSNADGTRTAQVLRNDSEHKTTWDVNCYDYGRTARLTQDVLRLTAAQRLAREWTR